MEKFVVVFTRITCLICVILAIVMVALSLTLLYAPILLRIISAILGMGGATVILFCLIRLLISGRY